VKKILESLDIETKGNAKSLVAKIPTYRIDLKTKENLVEEIGRIYGYEKIVPVAPKISLRGLNPNKQRLFERSMKNALIGQGFSELYNYAFYGLRDAELTAKKHLELEMPLTPEHAYLRTSLFPNIFKNVRENLKNFKQFQFFELGKIYLDSSEVLPEEKAMLVGVLVAEKKSAKVEKGDKREATPFFEIKSQVDEFLRKIGIGEVEFVQLECGDDAAVSNLWHKTRSAEIKLVETGETIGIVGEANPLVLENFDINTRVGMFEFDVVRLQKNLKTEIIFSPIGKYPTVTRDISMVVGEGVLVAEIISVIKKIGGTLVLGVELFDIFAFENKTTSFAFHVMIGAGERTLEGPEIDGLMNNIMTELEKNPKIEVRK
jgi:phenylalanyl-tRNA synthetase beta chain